MPRCPARSRSPSRVPIGEGDSRGARITAEPVVAGGRVFTLDARATVTRLLDRRRSSSGSRPGRAPRRRAHRRLGRRALDRRRDRLREHRLRPPHRARRRHRRSRAGRRTSTRRAPPRRRSWATLVLLVGARQPRLGAGGRDGPRPLGGPGPALDRHLGGRRRASRRGATSWSCRIPRARCAASSPKAASCAGPASSRAPARARPPPMPRPTSAATRCSSGSTVYVGTFSGRTAALDAETGETLWSIPEGARRRSSRRATPSSSSTTWASFFAWRPRSGGVIWRVALPAGRASPRRHRLLRAGPRRRAADRRLLGRGAAASSTPRPARRWATSRCPSGAASAPVVAGATLYIVTEDGRLNAFR